MRYQWKLEPERKNPLTDFPRPMENPSAIGGRWYEILQKYRHREIQSSKVRNSEREEIKVLVATKRCNVQVGCHGCSNICNLTTSSVGSENRRYGRPENDNRKKGSFLAGLNIPSLTDVCHYALGAMFNIFCKLVVEVKYSYFGGNCLHILRIFRGDYFLQLLRVDERKN